MRHNVLFARQSIYDRKNTLYGFELLYRGDLLLPPLAQAAKATTEVLVNYCTGIIQGNTILGCPILLKVDENFITSNALLSISSKDLLLEILDSVRPTPEVIHSLKTLRKQGYTLVLDNFIFKPENEVFLPLVSIIKIDVLGIDISNLEQQLHQFNFTGKILLAQKVEDQATYDICKKLGFDLFQGYYLEHPTLTEGCNFTGSKQTLLSLVSNLCRDDITVEEVSDLISTDPSLILKILKIVNCPLYPYKREITNLTEAVIKLGIVVVKQWAVILSLVASSSQPNELFRTLLVRAKACNLFAIAQQKANAEDYFIIGLFSGLDAVLGVDMQTLINNVHFSAYVKNELLSIGKDKESIVALVINYEKGQPFSSNVIDKLDQAYWEGTSWADEMMQLVMSS